MIPQTWFANGFEQLVSVIPPNAPLSPQTTIKPESRGKSPGVKNANGTWIGYDWIKHITTEKDVATWAANGANIGLQADLYPAIDIDVLDEELASILVQQTHKFLGPAPVRTGRAPKQLLMYRLEGEPFGRMALKINDGKTEHLLEILGAGRQYLIFGQHPTGAAYRWNIDTTDLTPEALTPLSRERAQEYLDDIKETLEMVGYEVQQLGDGRTRKALDVDQEALRAPSLEALADAVGLIPNTDELFPSREDYIKMGYAIRAAGGDEAEQIFVDWALSWPGNGKNPHGNEPAMVEADWRRIGPPFQIGWSWIAELARAFGFNDAAFEFDAPGVLLPSPSEDLKPHQLSEAGLAAEVVAEHGSYIRFEVASHRWMVWDGVRWAPDALGAAEERVSQTLVRLADGMLKRAGASQKEQATAERESRRLGAATTRDNVLKLVKTNPAIAARPESFDYDGWLLNTPGGTVDLRTSDIAPPNPSALMTKTTRVAPSYDGAMPLWRAFLKEVTDGDAALEEFLQRVAGYAATGSTKEQVFFFVWGPGGNGKSVFLNTISQILGDYAKQAPMDMFAATHGDRHPTDLAGLHGARLVAASETQAGRRWDEAKMKALTGGEPISARFMRGDFFTYHPHFKLLFVGNHKPQIRDIDAAMRRRIILVPFTVTPKVIDKELSKKLEAEYPAILSWLIVGAIKWRKQGLATPDVAQRATLEYFEDEDAVQRWINEQGLTETSAEDPEAFTLSSELYRSWTQWANQNGEYVGSLRRMTQALVAKGFVRSRHHDPSNRRKGFLGLKLNHERENAWD